MCSHAPCPCCGATAEDGQLVELDDAVSFSASSTFVSDITDDLNLADKLWRILSRAEKGWSTNDLRQACGLRKADDVIALLSRWEMEGQVVLEAPVRGANRLQSMLWLTSDRYKEVIEEDRAREIAEMDQNGAGRWTPGIPSHSWQISCMKEFLTFTFLRIREPSSLGRYNSIVLLIRQFLGQFLEPTSLNKKITFTFLRIREPSSLGRYKFLVLLLIILGSILGANYFEKKYNFYFS